MHVLSPRVSPFAIESSTVRPGLVVFRPRRGFRQMADHDALNGSLPGLLRAEDRTLIQGLH